MQYQSKRERAEKRMKMFAILALLVVIGVLAWFWSMGGEQPMTTITEPVTAQQQAG